MTYLSIGIPQSWNNITKITIFERGDGPVFSIKFEDTYAHLMIPVADGVKMALDIIDMYQRNYSSKIKVKRTKSRLTATNTSSLRKVGRPRKK